MDAGKFFATVRTKLGPLGQAQVDGINHLLKACAGLPLAYAAYLLATAWHETNKTMQPVREAYWLSESWRKANLRYYPWYGRGYVQVTWEANYQKIENSAVAAGLCKAGDIMKNPDKMMDPDISALAARVGMEQGLFTGVSFAKVLPAKGTATRAQYMNARTIINGRDKADLIEDYAQAFEGALFFGGYGNG